MPKPTIGYTNLTGSTVTLTDLADSSCDAGAVKILSGKNNFDDIVSSDELHLMIEDDSAFLYVDGSVLTKEESLRIMDLYKNAKDPAISYFTITGARNGNSNLDRDLKIGDVFFNQTPEILFFDCTLVGITCGTNNVETWEAHVYKNGVSVASVSVTNKAKESSPTLNIPWSKLDEIRLRQENAVGNVARPRITAWFKINT
mgnify:CR=1 FL=1